VPNYERTSSQPGASEFVPDAVEVISLTTDELTSRQFVGERFGNIVIVGDLPKRKESSRAGFV
jgi:hypothetical protein